MCEPALKISEASVLRHDVTSRFALNRSPLYKVCVLSPFPERPTINALKYGIILTCCRPNTQHETNGHTAGRHNDHAQDVDQYYRFYNIVKKESG
jgi:hypothetical protein